MDIKVTEKLLSIPPHLSASWAQIAAIRMKGPQLSLTMTDGETINIGGLTAEQIDEVFKFHAAYLESTALPVIKPTAPFDPMGIPFGEGTTFSFALGMTDGILTGMQHNPEQAGMIELPDEMVGRISEIIKALGVYDVSALPKGEPDCNCFYCQVMRKMNQITLEPAHELIEEVVADEELRFEDWRIEQAGEQLYTVINQLDEGEKYTVFLGNPVGCTCGQNGCAHILAVLKS